MNSRNRGQPLRYANGFAHLMEPIMTRRIFPVFAIVAACLACSLLGACANDGRFDHPGPPHPGAVNPYSNGGFSDPGPDYPATGH